VLHQNAPNPFNPETMIRFDLNTAEPVRITILDVHGRVVAQLLDETLPAGPHQVSWSGEDGTGRAVASGVYFYRLETPSTEVSRKMVLAR
jgi:flagellar hook assembly protein FlgD